MNASATAVAMSRSYRGKSQPSVSGSTFASEIRASSDRLAKSQRVIPESQRVVHNVVQYPDSTELEHIYIDQNRWQPIFDRYNVRPVDAPAVPKQRPHASRSSGSSGN